jgi:hypothetical protein
MGGLRFKASIKVERLTAKFRQTAALLIPSLKAC